MPLERVYQRREQAAERLQEFDAELGTLRWWNWRRRRHLRASFAAAVAEYEAVHEETERLRAIQFAVKRIR